jgi:trimethylamine--corrinoid protein Co-methyltransferase
MIADYLHILSQDQISRLHESALELLQKTGFIIKNREARELLQSYGAMVSEEKQSVCFPGHMVNNLIGKAPSFYSLAGRTPDYDLDLNLTSSLTRPIAGCNKIFDWKSQRRRDPSTKDMVDAAKLVDALPNFNCNAAFIYGTDEPAPVRAIHYLMVLLENTQKHICMSPYGPRDVDFMIEMGIAIRGSKEALAKRPIFNVITSPVSPLVFSEHFSAAIMQAARAGVPIMMGSTPIAGGTGPVTLAGMVALMHAENLAGLMIAQVAHPGCPIYFGPRPTTMDMKSGASLWGPIEWGIASSAAVQVARWCGIPTDFMGVGSDSKLPDQQSGIERSMLAVVAFLTAPSLISGGGYIDTINTGSLEQLAIDDEVFAMARRLVSGIVVDSDHLALDVIDRVGHGNTFLGEEHTRQYFRKEHFIPKLADRQTYGVWEERGAKNMAKRAREQVENTLASHRVPPLSEDIVKELQSIFASAKREYLKE